MDGHAPLSELDRLTARSSPAGFAWIADGKNETGDPELGWLPYPHLTLLSDKLMQVAAGQVRRLIVTMPPRHGKSQLISQFTAAWYLGTYPRRKVMIASNTATLAYDFSRKARDALREYGPDVFGVMLKGDAKAADRWELTRGGMLIAAGVGGPLTGRGAHLLIIDDPIKNDEEAASETIREKHWSWWKGTARTRLQKGGCVVVVQTRWHEDDLAGRMLAQMQEVAGGDQWELLNLPALAEPDEETGELNDPVGRVEGQALCPDLMPADELAITRMELGTYHWTALYQQKPRPAEGLLYKQKDFRYFAHQPDAGEQYPLGLYLLERDDGLHPVDVAACVHFQTADTADSEKEMADFTVVSTWAVTPVERELLLVNVERAQFERERAGALLEGAYRTAVPRPVRLTVENAGPSGPKVIKQLLRKGLPVGSANPDTDKVTRALLMVALYEAHRVYHHRGRPWLREWEDEHLAFPNAAHDDQVDTGAYAAIELQRVAAGGYRQKGGGGTEMGGLLGAQL